MQGSGLRTIRLETRIGCFWPREFVGGAARTSDPRARRWSGVGVAATSPEALDAVKNSVLKIDPLLMIDGIVIAEYVMCVALGTDSDGKKHVLGVREGATENAASCTAAHRPARSKLASSRAEPT
jgi:hypothetical protein